MNGGGSDGQLYRYSSVTKPSEKVHSLGKEKMKGKYTVHLPLPKRPTPNTISERAAVRQVIECDLRKVGPLSTTRKYFLIFGRDSESECQNGDTASEGSKHPSSRWSIIENELLDTTYSAPSLESLDMTCWYGVSKRLEIEQEESFIHSFF